VKKINVKGPIVSSGDSWIYDWLGIESTSPGTVAKAIEEAMGDELEVDINSGGGDVFAGSEIYTALKSYKGNVTIRIVGLAGSAASVVAMAGNKVMMSPTAQIMIHNVSSRASGDHRDMAHTAEILKNANETIANAYMLKSGLSQKDLLDMMEAETWFTPQKALEHRLIDEIMFEENQFDLVAGYDCGILPQSVINKIRNTITRPISNDAAFLMQQKAEAQLKFIKLKEVE
jgi:ATP-dependent protease ClpP protease subunit